MHMCTMFTFYIK